MNKSSDQISTSDISKISLRTISTSDESEVSKSKKTKFQQQVLTNAGSYSGGPIIYGFRVEKLIVQLRGEFRYVQIGGDGLIESGKSNLVLEMSGHEVVRLVEYYEWTSRVGLGSTCLRRSACADGGDPDAPC